ncbi:MAG TPA: HAMP domain-containing sensor histidine kinase [Candidatus Dormibacteraeota bacterium]|nr:HAMP domain-containing sensor histidine kinase [Candidatus Dormibacteraeota bacterium]
MRARRWLLRLRLSPVDAIAIRVALAATGIVLAIYVAIAVVVVLLVQGNLTSQVDGQLQGSLLRLASQPPHPEGRGFDAPPGGPPGSHPFGPPLIVWTVHADGTVTCNHRDVTLPRRYWSLQEPETVSLGGTSLRLAGAVIGQDHVVVGISMEAVNQARSTLISAEAIVGPILLAVVFSGSLSIGRRVAAPIERFRQRQMEFTADASHELRTPLSVIEATTTLALAKERDGTWYRAAFERVHAESQRMRRLVEDLLWLARLDAPHGQPEPAPVDLGLLAERAADRFRALAETRGLSLSVQRSEEGVVVSAPPEWLDRLLGVLLDNACKYSREHGRVDVAVRAEGPRVRLTVDDSGPGIPPEERPRIFDRFHRATEGPSGAGLGLAIADAVVRATNGRWEIGSSPAGGASISVTWPRLP